MAQRVPDVPVWLQGAWSRNYIRRADATTGELGARCSRVEVRYVQTPWAFVDIRRPLEQCLHEGEDAGTLAFGGVTTVSHEDGGGPVVHWHACVDLEWRGDASRSASAWAAADTGCPLPTSDTGVFRKLNLPDDGTAADETWRETDPGNTLEEEWVKHGGGDGPFLVRRRGHDVLVAAWPHFALAAGGGGGGVGGSFVAGTISADDGGWTVDLSAGDRSAEGKPLVLAGSPSEWLDRFGEGWAQVDHVNVLATHNFRFPRPGFSEIR